MKNYLEVLWLTVVILMGKPSFAQDWLWVQDDRVLNPSGIDIRTNSTQFQVLDWNGDGLWDFMINETGQIVYYEQVKSDKPFWVAKPLALPAIGFNEYYYVESFPKNFEFFDWDLDGDFDLAADSSRFWWNQGSFDNPVWVRDDSLLRDIREEPDLGKNFFFLDYDEDGDWDALADVPEPAYFRPIRSYFFLNQGDNIKTIWVRVDSLLEDPSGILWQQLGRAKFVDWNSDAIKDLAIIIDVLVTGGGPVFAMTPFINTGSIFAPIWLPREEFALLWGTLDGYLEPAYDLVDYDNDGLTDVLKSDWRRHLAIHFNKGKSDSLSFVYQPDLLLGAVTFEHNARPNFFYGNADDRVDLLAAGDFLIDFQYNVFPDGQFVVYTNLGGKFDPSFRIKENAPKPSYTGYPHYKRNLTLSLADVDTDGDLDYLLACIETNQRGDDVGKRVLFYQNEGTATEPNWQSDSTHFTYFLEPDSNFYDPRLVDIDHDGDFDLFLQKQGIYTFYARLNTEEESWQENPAWLSGLDAREHYSAVFADLTRDGKEDLIFGKFDGTLSLFENVGTENAPAWKHVAEAFAGIDVDSLAAPAFADLDGDSRLDLVVGNADGWLFYFRNESTVDVSSETDSRPGKFQLFQNYPNPFNPETTIEYELAQPGHVQLTIYNLLGQRVKTLVDDWQPAGSYWVSWDGNDEGGARSVSSGVYVYELQACEKSLRRKMILIR